MFFAFIFVCNRILQIITLIPTMGMLSWFVNGYNKANALTPVSMLVLFIVSIIALAWALFTLFTYHRSSQNAFFVGIVDILIFGALIAAVYELRGIADVDCTSINRSDDWTVHLGGVTVTGSGYNWTTDKPCAMLKASFAFGIINVILFFVTSMVAFGHGDRLTAYDRKYTHRSHHSSRHSHRSRSRSGSRYSHRSSPHRRVYV